ncbi:DUF3888 domain-containing protein [Bacillus sp. SM2101]|uniref:DUF3888 domain-containing protein n=1 Tax=Bacillus sp. SM2101 TaxID=2805366 RepID=UPI001BDEB068|nr:DUF3888 domain-containing protein [Bacillus sp. SM2101]
MKKKIISVFLLVLFLIPTTANYAEDNYYHPVKKSNEELMMDLFSTLLLPDINKAVNNYYKDYLKTNTTVYPYQIQIAKMERIGGYRRFEFLITIEVTPVVGAHISVGKDQLTFYISSGNVKMKDFKHIETHKLPPHWQDIIIKELPL